MTGAQRSNLILTVVTVAVAVFMALWLCPYLKIFGHEKLCIGLYALLVIIYLYGRSDARRQARRGGPAQSR